LDQQDKGTISRDSVMAVMLILNQDIPEIKKLSMDERNIIFAFLDTDGSSSISLDEFLEFGKILLLDLSKQSDYATTVQKCFPEIYGSNWYQRLCRFVRSMSFEDAIDAVLVFNAVVIAIQDYPELAGHDVTRDAHYYDGYIDTVWEQINTVFTIVYVLEAALKINVDGWKKYSESPRQVYRSYVVFSHCTLGIIT
jgi:two pore calcium channel protein